MHGFLALISTEKLSQTPVCWKATFSFQKQHLKRTISADNYLIEQFTSELFIGEKQFIDNARFTFVTEGIVHNLSQLSTAYQATSSADLIEKLYAKNDHFFEQFEGNFLGIFYDKIAKKWLFFNNQYQAKKLFYYHDRRYTVVSSDLFTLSKLLSELNISKSLDIEASYLLLTSGFMHDDKTLLQEIRQICAGEYAILSDDVFTVDHYFHLNDIAPTKDSKKEIICNLDHLFRQAVRLEYEVDSMYGYSPLTTISGGLDSRMTSLVAYQLGYTNQHLFNFSEKDYADDIIAKEIAEAYAMPICQVPLLPESLLPIDDNVLVNDGLSLYSGCSHAFYSAPKLGDTGSIVHTGMLGDAVFGTYKTATDGKMPITAGCYSTFLINKATPILRDSIKRYKDEQTYKFYNRGFHGMNTGFLFFDLVGETSSPFLNNAFFKYAYSIPTEYKIKERIYIDWLNTVYPEFAKFTWEAIGGPPTNNEFLRQYYRYKRAIVKRLPVKSMWKRSMNPEQYWYDNSKLLQQALNTYYLSTIDYVFDRELKEDVSNLFINGGIVEKTQALTLMSAIKLLF